MQQGHFRCRAELVIPCFSCFVFLTIMQSIYFDSNFLCAQGMYAYKNFDFFLERKRMEEKYSNKQQCQHTSGMK